MTDRDDAPRSTKGARTQARLIESARRRFGRDEYAVVSVAQVARDCGLTPAAAYAYFDSKQALFDAALDAEVDEWLGAAAAGATGDRPMAAWFAALRLGLDAHPMLARVLRSGDGDQLRRVLDSTPMDRLRNLIEAGLAARQESGATTGEFPARELADGTQMIIFALLTFSVRTGLAGEPHRVAGIVSLFQAALGRPDAPPPAAT